MSDQDGIAKRGRSLEDEYFWKKDRELIEKLRQAAAAEQARKDLGRKAGLDDPQLVQELQDSWIHARYRRPAAARADRSDGVGRRRHHKGGARADRPPRKEPRHRGREAPPTRQLTEWLTNRPSEAVFARATRLIRAMLDSGSEQTADLNADDLVKYCEEIASASGGILGIGRISAEERALLTSIAADLNARRT